MAIDPRSPVVVGVGQTSQRVPADDARPPIELFEDAARAAEVDSGVSLLGRVDIVATVQIVSWRYPNPSAYVARRLGIEPRATAVTTTGGNSPQILVNEFATRIQNGECDVVLIGGAESMYTRWRARREPKYELTWDTGDDANCEWVIGDDTPGSNEYEMAHGALAPTLVYPLFETALRAEAGRGIDEHQKHVSELWASFAAVAAENPHAWSRTAYSPEQIRTVTPDNRMVVFPYPKLMCSNIDVDQGAALILCSYAAARAAGVADEKMVFLHSAGAAHDHYFVTERDTLTQSPAISAAYWDAIDMLEHTSGKGTDDIEFRDIYSCFPAAVQIGARAVGLSADDPSPLTVTGGLGFAGGPVNNYPTHGIARMVETLRAQPGSFGLTTALGWYMTKHALGIWSTQPPGDGFKMVSNTQDTVDRSLKREAAGLVDGKLTVEATSVAFERDGTPSSGLLSLLTSDGRRALARCTDKDTLTAMTKTPWEGQSVAVRNDGSTNTLAG